MTNWPDKTIPACRKIRHKQEAVAAMIRICLDEGVEGQNFALISDLAPIAHRRCMEIMALCREILSHIPEGRRGRYPKWITTTMDISALADLISRHCEAINQARRQNLYITVARHLEQASREAEAIKANLDALPCDDIEIPHVFKEAFADDD